jgi:hypothetical protein
MQQALDPEDIRFLQQEVLQLDGSLEGLPAWDADAPPELGDDHPAMQRILATQRAWRLGTQLIACRTAGQLTLAKSGQDAAQRERAQRWCRFVLPMLGAFGTDGGPPSLPQAIGLMREVLPDAGAAFAACLLELRDELDASREPDADAQRRMAQLRYLGTSVALAAKADPKLPEEVAEDYLRAAMLTLLAWAWARIERAAGGDTRWCALAEAFRRWVLPEFDMRIAMVKRACEGIRAKIMTPYS